MRMPLLVSAAGLSLLAALAGPVAAQDTEPAPEAPAEAAPAPRKPKPRPKPKPKPAEKAAEKAVEKPAEEKAAAEAPPNPAVPLAPAPSGMALAAAPPVACEKGEAVRYEGSASAGKAPGAIELWVTRSGLITIDNPLRPLTPDTTRVLQVVIGGKVATAYGPDLQSLRRGAGPAVLEGVIGGAIRWDAALIALPDTLPILSDSGDILAAFGFRACGTAPAAKTLAAPKARRTAPPADAAGLAPETGKDAAKDTTKEGRPARRAEPRPETAPRPAVPLPQGAIP